MHFNFEVNNMIIKQKKTRHYNDDIFCSFVFTTQEWKHLEKYAIFWNRQGKSTIRYLGEKTKGKCPVPEMVLDDLYFYMQVYANDDTYTQKIKVFVNKDVNIDKNKYKKNKCRLNEFFSKLDKKIDKIIYDDNKFLVYANNTLIESFDVVDEALITKILTEVAPKLVMDTALSEDSDLPVSSRLVYQALQTKVNVADLPPVATTGSFNDLNDIPEEFPPAPHTHNSNDIIDLNDSIDDDFEDFLEKLVLEFEGD